MKLTNKVYREFEFKVSLQEIFEIFMRKNYPDVFKVTDFTYVTLELCSSGHQYIKSNSEIKFSWKEKS